MFCFAHNPVSEFIRQKYEKAFKVCVQCYNKKVLLPFDRQQRLPPSAAILRTA
jgi:hypothetical protein